MKYILWTFYDILYATGLFISLPFYGRRFFGRDGKFHDFLERFAIYDDKTIFPQQKRSIWIHAVSIGELLASFSLIEELSVRFKDRRLILSCVSRSARTIAEEKLSENTIKIFLPFDFSVVVDAAVRKWKPGIFVSIEAEIWPNLFRTLKDHDTPIVILNGRISEKSFRAYSSFRIFLKKTIGSVDCFIMRGQKDAENIIKLGADEKRVFVAGSMKFDYAYRLSEGYIPEKKERTVVFGSIHRGEEEQIAEITGDILEKYDDVNVVVVPRALDRTNIYQILRQKNIRFERYSQNSGRSRVLVVDRYGVLTDFYSKCEFAFVGGSLVPAGGQNPIEPLAFRKPVIYGKFHEDFEEEWAKILEAGAGFEVRSFEELSEKVKFLLDNPQISRSMGEAGYRVILDNKGRISKIIRILEGYFNEPDKMHHCQ